MPAVSEEAHTAGQNTNIYYYRFLMTSSLFRFKPTGQVEDHHLRDNTPGMSPFSGAALSRSHLEQQVSSYLVAYANGPFEYLETKFTSSLSGKTIPLRIYGNYLQDPRKSQINYLV